MKYIKKRKYENDATRERVMAILTANTSCSCRELPPEQCCIHGQPVKFEVDPILWAERKEKKREYNKNLRQDVRQKELMLLEKATEDLTPEEFEMVQKIKEKKIQHNLNQKNRYHSQQREIKIRKEMSRQEEARENSPQTTEEVEATNVPFVPSLKTSFSNDKKDSTTVSKNITVQTSEVFKAAIASDTGQFIFDSTNASKVLPAPKSDPEAVNASNADSGSHDADDSGACENMGNSESQISVDQVIHDSSNNIEIEKSQTSAVSATHDSSDNMETKKICEPKELTDAQKLRRSEIAKRKYHEMSEDKKREKIKKGTEYTRRRRQKIKEEKAKHAELMGISLSEYVDPLSVSEKRDKIRQYAKNRQRTLREKERMLLEKRTEDLTPEEFEMVRQIREKKRRHNLYWKNRYHSLTLEQRKEMNGRKNALKRQRAREKPLKKTENGQANIALNDQLLDDSSSLSGTITDSESLQKTEEVEANIAQNDHILVDSLSSNNVEPIDSTTDSKNITVLETLEVSKAAGASNVDSVPYDSNEKDSNNENMDIPESQHYADSATHDSRKTLPMTPAIKPLEFARDPEVFTVLEAVPVAVEASLNDFHKNMEIEESQTLAVSATHDSSKIEKPRRKLNELEKAWREEIDKREALLMKGAENKRKKRLKPQEERENNVEPLDEANLKMLLDIIQSLGPADQGQAEAA